MLAAESGFSRIRADGRLSVCQRVDSGSLLLRGCVYAKKISRWRVDACSGTQLDELSNRGIYKSTWQADGSLKSMERSR